MDGKDKIRSITIILTPEECKILKNICMEVMGNFRWKMNKDRANVLNKILDKLEDK